GRARLDAGGLQPDRDTVRTQGALVYLVVALGQARHVERAAAAATAAADAVLLVEVDDAIRVLHDRAGRRARLQAARIGAMHAAILADEPLEVAFRILVFGEAHQRPRVLGQVVRVLVRADV